MLDSPDVANRAQLLKIGVLGYNLKVDTADMAVKLYGCLPAELSKEEAYEMICELELMSHD